MNQYATIRSERGWTWFCSWYARKCSKTFLINQWWGEQTKTLRIDRSSFHKAIVNLRFLTLYNFFVFESVVYVSLDMDPNICLVLFPVPPLLTKLCCLRFKVRQPKTIFLQIMDRLIQTWRKISGINTIDLQWSHMRKLKLQLIAIPSVSVIKDPLTKCDC